MKKLVRYLESFESLSEAIYAVVLGLVLMGAAGVILWFVPGVEFFPN